MKEFITAAVATDEERAEDIEIRVDGRDILVEGPGSGQLSLLMAALGDTSTEPFAVATMINFLFSMIGPSDARYLKSKLFDRDDPFGAKEISDILIYLVEEWSGRPTESRDASTTSRGRTGRTSTAASPRKASTRSRSARTAS